MTKRTWTDRVNLFGEYQKWVLNYVINIFYTEPPSSCKEIIYGGATTSFIDTRIRKYSLYGTKK